MISVIYLIIAIAIIIVLMYFIEKNKNIHIENIKNIKCNRYKVKQKIYTEILKKTKKATDRLGIPFFLSSGTCLGYFRDGKFIDYDYDIDVGIWYEDYNPSLVKEMEKEGLKLYRVWGNKKIGMELSFILPNTPLGRYAKIDVFLHYRNVCKDGKKTVSWFTYAPKKKKRIEYRVSEFSLQKTNFSGVEVYVPYPTLKYIEEHYGDDWMIPKRPRSGYNYWSSPRSIVKT